MRDAGSPRANPNLDTANQPSLSSARKRHERALLIEAGPLIARKAYHVAEIPWPAEQEAPSDDDLMELAYAERYGGELG